MENELKVSVCVVTYNQEKYIAECLQSLVEQETDFKYEIVVSDDCSTDDTRKIIRNFHEIYPDIFRIFLHEENIGALKNFKFVHDQAAGEYVAHIDGDDYALPGKLQAQTNFLDANPDCNIVFHRMDFIDGDNYAISPPLTGRVLNYKFYRPDIINYIAIGANSSKMYRSKLNSIILPDFDLVDYTVNVIQVDHGYAAYCSGESLGVYRRGIGISGSTSVNNAAYNSLSYFLQVYPMYKCQINTSVWAWFLSNLKNGKETKWKFFQLIIKMRSLTGLINYLLSRKFRKELSGL